MWNQEKLVVLTKCYNTGLESPDTRAIPPSDRARAEFSSQVCVAAVCTPPPAGYSGADGQLARFFTFCSQVGVPRHAT
jgi:hypothetical protein